MGQVRASHPRFKRIGPPLRVELTDDDRAILTRIYRHRFIRAADLFRLFPHRSPDRLSRRLTQLYRAALIDRPLSQVDRFREGGSQSLVYGLADAGAKLVAEQLGLKIRSGDWKTRNREYTRENLEHTLAVTKFMVDLELECQARGDLDLIPFDEILAKAPEATRKLPQPGRWAVRIQTKYAEGVVHLIPDAIFGLRQRLSDGRSRRAYFFLEVDRGTMTVVPKKRIRDDVAFLHRASILRKLVTLQADAIQALSQRLFNISQARTLFVASGVERINTIRAAIESLDSLTTLISAHSSASEWLEAAGLGRSAVRHQTSAGHLTLA